MSQHTSCRRLVEKILEEIYSLPRGPFWVRDVVVEKRYSFPVTLNVGNGKQIYITPEIDAKISSLSKSVMNEFFEPHKSDFTNSEWRRMVKRALGEAIFHHDDEAVAEKGAGAVLGTTRTKLRGWISSIQEREYVFGCDFCDVSDPLKSLSIGSVLFEPRLTWLEKMYDSGNLSKTSLSRVARTWQGDRLRKRKDSEDQLREEEILDTIGECAFVCSVAVAPAGAEAGRQKALLAARVAMAAISLAWEKPSSVLDVMGIAFDREPYRRQNLVLLPNGGLGHQMSWSYLPGGVTWMQREEWDNLVKEFDPIFDCAGEVVKYATLGGDAVSRPDVLKVLFQALLWFHEGCREQSDPMAIVKLWAAMEALSCGRKKRGIVNLVRSRLVIKDEEQFLKDIDRIYRDGRSRTVHGTSDKLGHDWSDDRQLAEGLARLCLLSCLQRASESPQLRYPRQFSD